MDSMTSLTNFWFLFSLGVFILCNFAYFQNVRIWQYSPPPRHRSNVYANVCFLRPVSSMPMFFYLRLVSCMSMYFFFVLCLVCQCLFSSSCVLYANVCFLRPVSCMPMYFFFVLCLVWCKNLCNKQDSYSCIRELLCFSVTHDLFLILGLQKVIML